jgi:predicted ATPase/class 3 adenylate cyclase
MSRLPTGTVTFLFTDVEGSTRLAQAVGDRFLEIVQQQRDVLRVALAAHGGIEVSTEGDGLFAVFPTAGPAVAAAVEAQKALGAHPWPSGVTVRVRMGLHTGEAAALGDDYVGLDVHRAARISAAGHGGQILISESTRALLDDADTPDLKDLGPHRLKDLQRPERLYQVLASDLPSEFPPLRSLNASPNNLPVQLTSFIGRTREIAQARQMLNGARLVSLLGPGGTGKTRLALQVAAEVFERFPDGIWLVELAPISDPMLVPEAVASAVGIQQPARAAADAVADVLRPKKAVLVLDNCEHLQEAVGALCDALLRRCPDLRILATSREALGVAGEITFRVPPLGVPGPEEVAVPEHGGQFAAMQLFVERAAQYRPGFQVTTDNIGSIAQICRRLDGMPLAIELAAARVKVLTVEQIAARLDDRFRLLTGGFRTGLPHHQTLRATMDWSYDLLAEDEACFFRRVAVFVGGLTLEAAERVCAGGPIESAQVLDLLARLIDKSLVVAEDAQSGEQRYRLLETIRQYALDRLVESGEAEMLRMRHQEYYQRLAEQAELHLHGPEQKAWLDRLQIEHDNIRSALQWTTTDPAGAEAGLRLAGALWWFWEVRGFWSEGRRWLGETLTRGHDVSLEARVKAMQAAASLAMWSGHTAEAGRLAQESLALSQQIGDKRSAASCLVVLGIEACRLEDYRKARVLGSEGLDIASGLGDNWGSSLARMVLAFVAREQRDFETATQLVQESLRGLRAIGHQWGIAIATNTLGLIARDQGDEVRARELLEDAFRQFEALGDRGFMAYVSLILGVMAAARGDVADAEMRLGAALRARIDLQDRRGIATCLAALGCAAAGRNAFERAARLFGAAEAARDAVGGSVPTLFRAMYEDRVAATRTALGDAAIAAAWAVGRAMPADDAVAYALHGERSAA